MSQVHKQKQSITFKYPYELENPNEWRETENLKSMDQIYPWRFQVVIELIRHRSNPLIE